MTKPIRIQRKRTKGWRMPPNTIYVGRPNRWGNPYKVGDPNPEWGGKITPADAVDLYKNNLPAFSVLAAQKELRGKNLACFCPLDQPCYADVLLELANA